MAVSSQEMNIKALETLISDFLYSNQDEAETKLQYVLKYLKEQNPDFSADSLLELENILNTFKIENVVDHAGTACAIAGYIFGMKLVRTGQDLSNHAYTWLTNMGLLFSFACALSFVSSSYDLTQNYRRDHARMKSIVHHQILTKLMLRAWIAKQSDVNVLPTLKLIKALTQNQVKKLQEKCDTLILLERRPFLRKAIDEKEKVNQEIDEIENEIIHNAQENVNMIDQLIAKANSKSFFSFFTTPEKEKLKEENRIKKEIEEYKASLVDVMYRPLYNVDVRYDDLQKNQFDERVTTLSSTSLYGLRAEILRQMAVYLPFTLREDKTADILNDASLESLLKEYVPEHGEPSSRIFEGTYIEYHAIRAKIDLQYAKYNDKNEKVKITEAIKRIHQMQIRYLHLQDELKNIDTRIHAMREKLAAAEAIEASLTQEETRRDTPAHNTAQPKVSEQSHHDNLDASEKNELFHTKAPDTQTTYHWRKFWKEIKGFPKTIIAGLSIGIQKLLTPDDKKYAFHTQEKNVFFLHPRFWGYHCKCGLRAIQTNHPYLHRFLVGAYLLLNIPYFIWYALKRFGHLLTHLEKVVNAIHKSVRDIDQALAHRSGDNFLVTLLIRWPLKIVWAAITFIPETILGLTYWMLSVIGLLGKTENNIAKTSRAINPSFFANFVENTYLDVRQCKNKALILEAFIREIELSTHCAPESVTKFIKQELESKNINREYRDILEKLKHVEQKHLYVNTFNTLASDYRLTYNTTLFFLYVGTFFFGIVNTIYAPIKKCLPFGNARQVQHSRDQLSVAGKIMWGKVKAGMYALYADPIISAWKQHQEAHQKINAEYPNAWFVGSFKHLGLYAAFVGLFFLNTLVLATLRFIVNIAKTAPLITATAITTSTLFAGITLPLIGTIALSGKAQLATGVTALCSDTNNGSHDLYNLCASILTKDHMDRVESAALEKLENKRDSEDFNTWKSVFEKVEAGKIFIKDLDHKMNDKGDGSYSRLHAVKTKATLLSGMNEKTVRTILASHMAYYLVNTSKTGKSFQWKADQYRYLFDHFSADSNTAMSEIVNKMIGHPKYLSLNPGEKKDYITGLTGLLSMLYARKLITQIHQHYQNNENAFEIYLTDQKGASYQGKRNEQGTFEFAADQDKKITARPLSLWEQFKHRFWKRKDNVFDGYEVVLGEMYLPSNPHFMIKNTANQVNLSQGLRDLQPSFT